MKRSVVASFWGTKALIKRVMCAFLAVLMIAVFVGCTPEKKMPINLSDDVNNPSSSGEADETSVVKSKLPDITYLYNENFHHEAIGAYIKSTFEDVGIDVELEEQDWDTFLDLRSEGDYVLSRHAWSADYNDPLTFLELWTSDSIGNDAQLGRGAHAKLKMYDLDLTAFGYEVKVEDGTWAQTYDVLISKIKACKDKEGRYAMMHLAEDMLMDTGCIVPLYYYTDSYMIQNVTKGFYTNPLGYKFFAKSSVVGGPNEQMNVWMAEDPGSLDPISLFDDNSGTILSCLFSGLTKWTVNGKGNPVIIPDCAKELPKGVVNKDGTVTYTYTLKDNLKWSDGTELNSLDFVSAWKRAYELEAVYSYLFEVIDGYEDGELAISAPTRNTICITLREDVPYFHELLANPIFFPVPNEAYNYSYWGKSEMGFKCNGPYRLYSWDNDNYLMLDRNTYHYDSANVKIRELNIFFGNCLGDPLSCFDEGMYHVLCDMPSESFSDLKRDYSDELKIEGQMGTYFACWNVNADLLPTTNLKGENKEAAQAEIRKAMSLLIDRNYIVEDIAQGAELPAFSLVAMGMTDYGGSEFYKNANGGADKNGYYGYYNTIKSAHQDNVSEAMEVLRKYYKLG